jgi:hypothetical protein
MNVRTLAARVSAGATTALLFPLVTVHAQFSKADDTLVATGLASSGSVTSLPLLIGNFINVFLGTLGIVFVGMVVYGGFLYLTDGGKEENIKKAKKMMGNAVIGMVICVAAYAISTFVITQIGGATSGAG